MANGINNALGGKVLADTSLQPDDELFDTGHPQPNVIRERSARKQVHMDAHRGLAVVGFHRC